MIQKKYSFLYNKIPGLNEIINNKNLNKEELTCLEYIYNYYKSPSKFSFNKNELRKKLKLKRKNISLERIKSTSILLNKELIETEEYLNAETIFCYISYNNEIDTYLLLEHCLKNKKKLCVPVIKDNIMIPSRINNLNNLIKNKYKIPEPKKIIEIKKQDIDLTIVPALAYNPLGYRIGYGGGFYDKFLKDYKGKSVGMILKEFYLNEIIPDIFDEPVNRIIILS